MTDRVSVVIPGYNGRAFIAEALDSVFGQSSLPREIIVVDDASRDGTPELVEAIGRAAPVAVRLIRLARNSGGPARPINVGIEAASGDLICVLDQDDLLLPDKLQGQARALAEHPGIALAFSLCAVQPDPTRPVQEPAVVRHLVDAGVERDGGFLEIPGAVVLRLLLEHDNYILGYPGFLFRRGAWESKGGVDEGLRIGSDYDLLCWLCTRGPAAFFPRAQYLRRLHRGNMCNNRVAMCLDLARVKSRYLRAAVALAADPALDRGVRGWYDGMAYWMREAGEYRASLECYRLMARLWGPGGVSWALMKLAPHWALRRIARRPSRGALVARRPGGDGEGIPRSPGEELKVNGNGKP
jgi:glycosyltransferase involved in cell wall biosynthesis